MQRPSGLRAWIQDSPSSSSDAFVTTREPNPDLKTRGVRRSRTSPTTSIRSLLEPVCRSATLFPKSFSRTLSRIPSAPRGQIERQIKGAPMSTRRKQRASTVSGTRLTAPWETRGLEHNELQDTAIPRRPSTSPCESGRLLKSNLATWLSQRQSLDLPNLNLGISKESNHQPAIDIEHPLTRTTTRTTIASEASNDTDVTFALTTGHWQPPTSWAGPSPDEDRPKASGRFHKKKGPKGGSRIGSMWVYTRFNPARSVRKLKPVLFIEAEEPMEKGESAPQAEPLSSGVVVKIQSSEGDGRWDEKPMADIIPKLRELKFK